MRAFHTAQSPVPLRVETAPGVRCERLSVPVRAVGPVRTRGLGAPAFHRHHAGGARRHRRLSAAHHVHAPETQRRAPMPPFWSRRASGGIEQVFKVGGAQAIAAMAYGTRGDTRRCDKMYGPGNAWVTAAKLLRRRAMPPAPPWTCRRASPKCMVIADEQRARRIRGRRSAGPGRARSRGAGAAGHAVRALVASRSSARFACSARHCRGARSCEQSMREIAHPDRCRLWTRPSTSRTTYAPEHLILEVREPRALARASRGAGAVFLGRWSPEPIGRLLQRAPITRCRPTATRVRTAGCRWRTFRSASPCRSSRPRACRRSAAAACTLAGLEGLDAHAAAVEHASGGARGARRMSSVLALARPEILHLKPYSHAAWLPVADAPACERSALAAAGRCHGGRPQPLSRAAAARADRSAWRALRRAGRHAAGRPRQR